MVGDKASGWGNRSEQVAEPWLKRLQRGGPQTRRSWGTQRKRSTWLPSHLVSGHSDTHAGLVRNVAAIIHLNTPILILPLAASRPGHAAASGHVLDHEPILSPFWHPIPHPAHAWLPFPSTTSRDNHAVYDCIDATSILSLPPSLHRRTLIARATMLLRSARKIPPSFVLLLVFLVFLGWQLSQGPSHEELPPPPPPDVPAPPPVEAEQKPHEEEKKPLRIAVVTFVTDQRSYLHLSLKNKDRKSSLAESSQISADTGAE